MFSWFTSLMLSKRPYKIENSRKKRFGVSARNFEELLKKGCEQFEMDPKEVTVVLELDGTTVNSPSYFSKLPEQTTFIFLKNGETWTGPCDLIDEVFAKLNSTVLSSHDRDRLLSFILKDETMEKYKQILDSMEEEEDKVMADTIDCHESWFKGLKTSKTKSEYMRTRAQNRIRSYYQKAKKKVEEGSNKETKDELKELLKDLSDELSHNQFHGGYFVRDAAKERICDKTGLFLCEGPFNRSVCDEQHMINPYISEKHRVIFSLWELDHIIEKSRVVIPTLLEAARKKNPDQKLSWRRVYNLLFTRENLKLVQKSCHDKAARSNNLDWKTFVSDSSS